MSRRQPESPRTDNLFPYSSLFRFEIDVAVSSGTMLANADRDRLMQVFVNLLSNAAKFCDPDHGRVRVVGRPGDNGYFVSVSDNGAGVLPQDPSRIFEKLPREGGRRDRKSGG